MADSVEQTGNTVQNGDLVGRDKVTTVVIKRELPKAIGGIRDVWGFDPNSDEDNTTLTRKLIDGGLNAEVQRNAVRAKINTLALLIKFSQTHSGNKIVADMYENLITVINKHQIKMEEDELLKYKIEDIYEDFSALVTKYQGILNIDEPFILGLLYIATSNCAIRWKVEKSA